MKFSSKIVSVALLAVITMPVYLAAQRTRYKLVVIPTFGGPAAIGQVDGPGISQFINNSGVVVGGADTTVPDPYCLNPDCFTPHGFRWQDGVLSDLGALQEMSFSHATGEIIGRGLPRGCDNLDSCGRVFLLIPCDSAGATCEENVNSVSQTSVVAGTKRAIPVPGPERTKGFIERQRARIRAHQQRPERY